MPFINCKWWGSWLAPAGHVIWLGLFYRLIGLFVLGIGLSCKIQMPTWILPELGGSMDERLWSDLLQKWTNYEILSWVQISSKFGVSGSGDLVLAHLFERIYYSGLDLYAVLSWRIGFVYYVAVGWGDRGKGRWFFFVGGEEELLTL